MDAETIIRAEIAQIEASPLVIRLKALVKALDALTAATVSATSVIEGRRRPKSPDGVPELWKLAAGVLPSDGLPYADFRTTYIAARGSEISEPSFSAQLSKMKSAGLIYKRDGRWFATAGRNDAGADLPAASPASSVHSSSEGGDGRYDPATT